MIAALPIVALILGLAIGASCCWAALRGQVACERERANAGLSILSERAKAQEEASRRQEALIFEYKEATQAIEDRLLSQATALAAASQENKRLPALEGELAEAKATIERWGGDYRRQAEEKATLEETLRQEREKAAEKIGLIEQAEAKLSDAFKALASDALKTNNQSFLDQARSSFETLQAKSEGELDKKRQSIEDTMKPVRESLEKVDQKIQDLETARAGAYQGIHTQVDLLLRANTALQKETNKLVNALGTPNVRGKWGEIQLKRVVELAGMLNHCDFFEQQSQSTEAGRVRPDLVVRLPGGKTIVVDAKVPLSAYLEAAEEQDESRCAQKMKNHCKQVRDHISSLSKKNYFASAESSPEFVILFLPAEVFYFAALQHDPALIEVGAEHRVVIATPTTLIALLRTAHCGWSQDQVQQNTKEISKLGHELHNRISKVTEDIKRIGKGLGLAMESYNEAVGSIEGRVLVTARKLRALHAMSDDKEIEILPVLPVVPRPFGGDATVPFVAEAREQRSS